MLYSHFYLLLVGELVNTQGDHVSYITTIYTYVKVGMQNHKTIICLFTALKYNPLNLLLIY